ASEGGETVRRLQHFTQREFSTQDFTRIDLNEIVKEAIASTSPRWKDEAEAKGTTIKIKERLGKLTPLLGSRSELMEVLTNLIFNSLEAMPEGGEITIRTEAKENEVLLYFADTGKGIPKRIRNRIFDPFFTTKGPKASGLGLSTSYGIIKHHQGAIKVESTEGKGITFTISIPVPLEIPLDKGKLRPLEKISSREILVIDDEEGVRDVLGRIFQDEGHRVTLAETAKKGLAKFKQDNFDLVLTDLGMPEMSGWELAEKIKEIDPDMPIGLITGWAVAPPKEKMKEQGVDFILSKPFDLTKVVREVNAALKSKKR
ncbi:MAG: response regulator, partial [bacterium]